MGKISKKEIIIIAVTALLALAALFILRIPRGGGKYADVSFDGESIMRLELDDDGTYHIDALLPVTLVVANGKVHFYNSKCPDHLCEGFGEISEIGEYAICLPARVAVEIKGDE